MKHEDPIEVLGLMQELLRKCEQIDARLREMEAGAQIRRHSPRFGAAARSCPAPRPAGPIRRVGTCHQHLFGMQGRR
jgi:hypothetical protein